MTNINYKVSLYPSKNIGYQSKSGINGEVKVFISTIWTHSTTFEDFVEKIIYITILERICLERAFQKIRMRNRCNPCKMEKYAIKMIEGVQIE